MKDTIRIAVDAMGGDRAPRVVVEGAALAANEYNYDIVLVGDTRKIEKFLKFYKYPQGKLSIEHASQKVDMGEAAAISFRKKKDSSISVGLNLLKE
ncbi:MAG: phosphate--acyl-ACP acyltransferase, partial [Candidatus Omnitrophica bacterium]|nr:phosphate--acyl-ACP acyltransferase [Candidatus Omnitrophota bacterium]